MSRFSEIKKNFAWSAAVLVAIMGGGTAFDALEANEAAGKAQEAVFKKFDRTKQDEIKTTYREAAEKVNQVAADKLPARLDPRKAVEQLTALDDAYKVATHRSDLQPDGWDKVRAAKLEVEVAVATAAPKPLP